MSLTSSCLVVPDGYGLSYAIDDNALTWGVTTMNNDAEAFGESLKSAARELRDMMERAGKDGK